MRDYRNMTPEQYSRIVRLGGKAEELLADESFKEIIINLKQEAIRAWGDTNPLQVAMREEFWQNLQAVCRLESYLKELGETKRIEQRKSEQPSYARR